ncbi:hypothetical protein C8A05DRAFT_19352 [Staphylotrichum tortipilum]|uniref:Ribosomal protein bL31m N-terminal domain-containing protein n=1 Tax=Staphylotrichum tortipilum TaxID=2831512 RepID=A0AAN6MC36_9PEZI|nr:hypothetical protein C8A05DRAFT_19352 [Staphylotrichum longicolle]
MGKLPSTLLRRPSLAPSGAAAGSCLLASSSSPSPTYTPRATTLPSQTQCLLPQHNQQVRHATFVLRSRRPYQFTQLVQLSDGSTFAVRTTSPVGLYRSARDSRNSILWQPSNKTLRNVEMDEAGKLAAFRERYGTSWDLTAPAARAGEEEGVEGGAADGKEEGAAAAAKEAAAPEDPFDSLVDLISAYATTDKTVQGGISAKEQSKMDRSKKK